MKNNCTNCGGSLKHGTTEHKIETRHYSKPIIEVENLPVLKCKVCGKIEMTETSLRLIQSLEAKLQKEMEEMVEEAEAETDAFHSIKSFFKKIMN